MRHDLDPPSGLGASPHGPFLVDFTINTRAFEFSAQTGYSQVECDAWVGVLAPATTSKDIVTLLHQEMARAVKVPEIENHLVPLGFEPASTNPQELAVLIKSENAEMGEHQAQVIGPAATPWEEKTE